MSTSNTALRFAALLFLLAGLLLLKKPVFGQTAAPLATKPAGQTAVTALYTNAYAAMPNLHLIRIDDSRHFIMYDQPAAFDKAVQAFLKPREPDQAQTPSR